MQRSSWKLLVVFLVIKPVNRFQFKFKYPRCWEGKQDRVCFLRTQCTLCQLALSRCPHTHHPFSKFPSWCIWRDRASLCPKKPHSAELTALCLQEDTMAGNAVFPLAGSNSQFLLLLIVKSLCSATAALLGLIMETDEHYRSVIGVTLGSFSFQTQTESDF